MTEIRNDTVSATLGWENKGAFLDFEVASFALQPDGTAWYVDRHSNTSEGTFEFSRAELLVCGMVKFDGTIAWYAGEGGEFASQISPWEIAAVEWGLRTAVEVAARELKHWCGDVPWRSN